MRKFSLLLVKAVEKFRSDFEGGGDVQEIGSPGSQHCSGLPR